MNFFLLAVLIGCAYAAFCGYTYLIQDNLLYYPNPLVPSQAMLDVAGLTEWPGGHSSFRGFVASDSKGEYSALVVVFHGNAGSAWQRDYYVDIFGTLGFRVVLAEYPGYGGRPGRVGEENFIEDAKETVRLAARQFNGPVFLCGESLGAAVAAGVACDPPVDIAGLILITPWDSLVDVAARHYWYLPVRWLARDRYDSVVNLTEFKGRVAVVLAEKDEIVPVYHGERLYNSLKADKKLWRLPGTGHNNWASILSTKKWSEIANFMLSEALKTNPANGQGEKK